ncbi:nucleoside triphosphate pyrophosphohydrolase family protein [Candidatus Saccharibacteria bacterium]|nr:nucleoside triphosphate pyrophosphohydrolase family protein [Candidatus Saccharibacteria bacterium]
MKFDEYQKKAAKYDLAKPTSDLKDPGFIEKILGLVGEAGETADKIKKLIRDKNGEVSSEDKELVTKELGDTLWYIASISRYLNVPLSKIASQNINKLEDRYQRNQIHGEGDKR